MIFVDGCVRFVGAAAGTPVASSTKVGIYNQVRIDFTHSALTLLTCAAYLSACLEG